LLQNQSSFMQIDRHVHSARDFDQIKALTHGCRGV
jgi:hypothetical protein